MGSKVTFANSTGQTCVVSVLAEVFRDEEEFENEYRPRTDKGKLIYQTQAILPEIRFWPDYDEQIKPESPVGLDPTSTLGQPDVLPPANRNSTTSKEPIRQASTKPKSQVPEIQVWPDFDRHWLDHQLPSPQTSRSTIEMKKALDEVLVIHGDTQLMKELQRHMQGLRK
ncbi:hypothetical protein CPB83DRAFT_896222 [Crepidotus variabilis]|uniref:Uncharacterized protein n=1 Tax=Crepidotus variabilis TaxID=179855 RepID=A0A9P6ECP7_9AGAR|nr:hypothetical protein CPB83DRAFT_896222 [Crepidotus variabilis]